MKTIFDLHAAVLTDYRDFVCSFLFIADERARTLVDQALEEEGHLWPEPLVQLGPAYAPRPTLEELARKGFIAQETARIFRHADVRPFRLYRHQEEAIRKSPFTVSGIRSGRFFVAFVRQSSVEKPSDRIVIKRSRLFFGPAISTSARCSSFIHASGWCERDVSSTGATRSSILPAGRPVSSTGARTAFNARATLTA